MDTPPAVVVPDAFHTALAGILTRATSGIDTATDFLSAQVPDVIREVLVWNAVTSAMVQVGCVIAMLILFLYVAPKWDKYIEQSDDKDGATFAKWASMLAWSAVTVSIFMCHFDWLKIWLAPKLYLIEYAARLVQSHS